MIKRLLVNSRFWILAVGVVLSVTIAGFIQLLVPSGSLQIIRIEQAYGFVSILLLYAALLISPLFKVYPTLPGKVAITHARRAFGVLAFYYAFLHTYLTFMEQLGGIDGMQYYNSKYVWSIALGGFGLAVLAVMTLTSLDWVVRVMGFKYWKLLHRLVYLAGIAILVHIVLLGPHYANIGFLSTVTAIGLVLLAWIETIRFIQTFHKKRLPR